jgi:glycosyltransferase involved in cell wall biosynthesis
MSIGAAWPDETEVTARWRGEGPVVSVKCHAYNQRAYIEEALAGILCQRTDFPFEVILRDDASTDGTREVLQACAARYPRLVRLVLEPENRYRQGVKPVAATYPLARGEFIAMCEGDDRWLAADKLQAQVAFLRAAPDCGLVHSNYLNLILLGGAWKTRLALRTAAQRADRAGQFCAEIKARDAARFAYLEQRLNLTPAQKPLFDKWKAAEDSLSAERLANCGKARPAADAQTRPFTRLSSDQNDAAPAPPRKK